MSGFPEVIAALARRIIELERRVNGQARVGTVVEVDAGAGLARVRLTGGDTPFLTGWIPWEEAAAGANRTHVPPSVGQQVSLWSETGDLADAVIRGSVNSEANARPSAAGDEYVLLSVGEASVTVSGGGSQMVLRVGPSSITLTPAGIVADAPRIDWNS